MFPEFVCRLRPNNQITITLQNVAFRGRDLYQGLVGDCQMIGEESPEDRIRRNAKLQSIIARAKPLDIIPKSQRCLKLFRYKASKIASRVGACYWAWLLGELILTKFRILAIAVFRYMVDLVVSRSRYCLNRARRFTSASGQKILEAGAVVEMLCNGRPEFAHCTTLTLPADYRAAFECLAAYSGYAVNRLFQYLRRTYPDANRWFFVWEFQKRGALHLHICHYHPDCAEGQLIGAKLIELWHKVLEDISSNSGVCMFTRRDGLSCTLRQNHQHHTQPMIKGCGRYFAKYAMKGTSAKENDYIRKHSETLSPSRFWGSSQSVKELIKENSLELRTYDIFGNSEQKFNEMEGDLMEMEVISYREDSWEIRVKVLDSLETLVVSSGFRKTFYLSPKSYIDLLNRLRCPDESIA